MAKHKKGCDCVFCSCKCPECGEEDIEVTYIPVLSLHNTKEDEISVNREDHRMQLKCTGCNINFMYGLESDLGTIFDGPFEEAEPKDVSFEKLKPLRTALESVLEIADLSKIMIDDDGKITMKRMKVSWKTLTREEADEIAERELEERLQDAFEYVHKMFFPRWDKKGQWIAKLDPGLPAGGSCDSKNKTIVLKFALKNDDELHLLLIHEICHALYSGHYKPWQQRMLKAKDTANKNGRDKLSDMLQKEVDGWNKPNIESAYAKDVYNKIGDALVDEPNASYKDVIKWVANHYGFYPEELEKKHKKCREVYTKARKEQHISRQLQAKIRKKLGLDK